MLLKLAILISGRGSNMKSILNAVQKQNIPIKPNMDVLKGVEVIKIVPESLRGKYKIGQNMDMKSRVCLLYTSPSPRDRQKSRMPSSA